MAIAQTMKQREYVLQEDRKLPKEEQTVFILKPLGGEQQAIVEDSGYFDGKTKIGTQKFETLKLCLIGWKNFKTADGEECVFGDDMNQNIFSIHPFHRTEIFNFIYGLSAPTEEDEGNSASPPSGS